jgi:tRNA 2-selenouridine synthase
MKHDIATVERISELSSFDEIIDVRSPSEFAEDHIPGSINCPVLDDQQRIEVGTLYKQVSPFAARKIGAAYVAENIACHLRTRFLERPKNWRPLIVCWRGGQRSGSMTHVLRRVGWDAQQLAGGYKTYRRLVIDNLAEHPAPAAVQGDLWRHRQRQEPHPAGHRTTRRTGARPRGTRLPQGLGAGRPAGLPATIAENVRVASADRAAGLRPDRPVYVEAESRKIGSLQLPTALIETMRAGECVNIEATLDARVDFLLRDYDYFLTAPEWLNARLQPLRNLQSAERSCAGATMSATAAGANWSPNCCNCTTTRSTAARRSRTTPASGRRPR